MRARIGGFAFALIALAVVGAALVPRSAFAQAKTPALTSPPASPAPDQPPTAEPRGDNPGLINEIGKLWDKSSSMLPSLLPSGEAPAANPPEPAAPQSPPPEARRPPPLAAAPPAAEPPPPPASTALVPSMVSGKVQCPTAANGAPDCKVGADLLCQSKGYASGKSLSSDSVEACSAKRLIPGRERKPDDCHTNYFVTRAFCQ
jgi:hypothetical protein